MDADAASRIQLLCGDITGLRVDAIVNAANEALAGGGGVDGAIHRAAGLEKMQAACARLGGCKTGDAKITPGFDLPAANVIHTVGPVHRGGQFAEAALLESCYRRSMQVALENQVTTIAFPAISTGVYGFPFEDATRIAMRAVATCLRTMPSLKRVILIFFSPEDHRRAIEKFEQLLAGGNKA